MFLVALIVLSSFVVSHADAQISTNKPVYEIGESVTVSFSGVSGDASAWFAIYPAGQDYEDAPLGLREWIYANDSQTGGSEVFTEGTVTFVDTSKFLPGDYTVSYFADGGYEVVVSAAFSFVAEGTPITPPESGSDTEPGTGEDNPPTADPFSLMAVSLLAPLALVLGKKKRR